MTVLSRLFKGPSPPHDPVASAEFELAAALDKGVDMVWAEHVRSCTLPMAASCSTEIVCFTPTPREQTRIS